MYSVTKALIFVSDMHDKAMTLKYSHLRPVCQAVTLFGAAGCMMFDVKLIRDLNTSEIKEIENDILKK